MHERRFAGVLDATGVSLTTMMKFDPAGGRDGAIIQGGDNGQVGGQRLAEETVAFSGALWPIR